MKYYIIAGEASGDLHASNVLKALKTLDSQADFRCWGGDLMQAAGGYIVKHYKDLAFMGFIEVIQHLGTILKNIKFCKEDILQYQPDVILFVDYPGFNMRMAKWAKLQGFKTAYYVSPTVWAWKEKRVHHIHKYVDKMMVILPFEKAYYDKYGYKVHYVGHPLIEVMEKELAIPSSLLPEQGRKTIALLPGSRTQEIKKMLPVILECMQAYPDYDCIIAQAPAQEETLYKSIIGDNKQVRLLKNKTYDILKIADAAIVTSGTATLETALLGVPQVVVYKTSPTTYRIARHFVKVKYISLVNLILDKPSVMELIQEDCTVVRLSAALKDILDEGARRQPILADYKLLWQSLAHQNKASLEVAHIVSQLAQKK
ncbi:lipid-A-disaccharide synthase [Taibaiella sp. KBW10]|uniref:lipid-A-disaccharide synthase n=1 Tax=Taibaiella sp. KBW10 TaxID=2153357 RepID=UPI000F59B80B|nr:lipid-A-disaccharide synthase [Taibaiella sp. KBW10]RQO31918.1 lipid-A-disaccharide synthase [Taibaiella sp. KBW10]